MIDEPGRHQRRAGQDRAGPGAGAACATSATPRTPPQIQQNIVRINGQRSVYIPMLKQGGANTIAVVDGVEQLLPKITGLPKGMKLQAIFEPVHLHPRRDRKPRARSGLGRGAGLADDPDLPRQLPFDLRDLSVDPAVDPGRRLRPDDERLDHQHHDAGRLRARDRPAGRRLDGRAGEHQSPSGRGQATERRRRATAPRRSRCRCWPRPSPPSSCSFR